MGVDRKEVVTEYRARALGLPGREWGARLMSLEEESEESLHLMGRKCKARALVGKSGLKWREQRSKKLEECLLIEDETEELRLIGNKAGNCPPDQIAKRY